MMLAQAIRIEGTGDGIYDIDWTEEFATVPVDIHVGLSPSSIELDAPLISGAMGAARITGLECGVRHYFYLRPNASDGVIHAQRNVPLEGGVNFRDLGGYRCDAGRRIVWGRLYRSGHMSNLTAVGLTTFENLDIEAVCDFRLSEERENESIALPGNPSIDVLEIPPGVKDRFYFHRVFKQATNEQDVVAALHNVVRSMVDESAPRYQRLFEVLLEPGDRNILINCSAGKERTGVASALILTALGVPRETIYYDFMLSQKYFPAANELDRVLAKYEMDGAGANAEKLVMPLLETRESHLRAAFDFIDANYGGGLEFLRAQYGINPTELQCLRDKYTH